MHSNFYLRYLPGISMVFCPIWTPLGFLGGNLIVFGFLSYKFSLSSFLATEDDLRIQIEISG